MNATVTAQSYDGSSRRRQEADAVLVNRRTFAAIAVVAAGGLLAACQPMPPGVTGGSGSGGSGGTAAAPGPSVGGCPMFPKTNAWNQNVAALPVRSDSATLVRNISSPGKSNLHPDFGGAGAYGIPFKVVPATQAKVPIVFTAYGDESDPGPYPIPGNAPIEGGAASDGDRHVIVVQQGTCHLYELGRAFWKTNHWNADVGVNWNLKSNALRPAGWTSTDAAGLPILPGLVRYDEVAAGAINHAVRFTAPATQRGYILPATHWASSSTNPGLPPMGLRLRLKANFSLAGFHGQSLVILRALKNYGMIVADNGSSWYITGAADKRWNDDDLNQLKTVPGSAFEAVNTGAVHR
jgi:hypothetical protein